ncbi:MAG TPA: hypothetical protein VEK79_11755 [Thermoanaerobaculia bacterium]|nr:hypothetical protein [Thermoanaerobaculia bacterium]
MAANNSRAALVFAAALTLTPIAAEATIARAVKFDEKVDQAAAIVLGRVVSQTSSWDAAQQRILTYSKLQVEKTFKGFPSQEITIVTPGGVVGDVAQDYVGVPRFRTGDEHVVFVRNTKVGPTVLFLDQGAYHVDKDERGDRLVRPIDSNAVMIDTQRGVAVTPEKARSLRDFEGSVRETIRQRETMRMELIERKQREEASLWNQVKRNKTLVILALLGAMLATWQLVKRSS